MRRGHNIMAKFPLSRVFQKLDDVKRYSYPGLSYLYTTCSSLVYSLLAARDYNQCYSALDYLNTKESATNYYSTNL
jgi:hypothetical protein